MCVGELPSTFFDEDASIGGCGRLIGLCEIKAVHGTLFGSLTIPCGGG